MQLDTDKRHLVFFYFVTEEIREDVLFYLKRFSTNTKLSEVEMYDFHRHTEEGNQEMAW
jgi:hypothetical protein